MKTWVYLLLGAATALIFTACGKSGGSSNNARVAGVCQAGYVNSQYGCLQQAGCPVGYGLYNGQCVQATLNNQYNQCQAGYVHSSQYGCLPQNSCPQGYGLYNNQCVYADGAYNQYNNQYNYNNGGYNYNQGYSNPYMPNPYYNGGYNGGYNYGAYCYWYYGQMMCQ